MRAGNVRALDGPPDARVSDMREPVEAELDRLQSVAREMGVRRIISLQHAGVRYVRVGNQTFRGLWQGFFPFLDDYLQSVFGHGWSIREQKKARPERHPVMQWRDSVMRHLQSVRTPSGGGFVPMTGAASAYFGLAHNLFLLADHAEVRERLLTYLKHPRSFHSTYYETLVAAWFILADFELTLQDEGDPSDSHCEFSAISRPSGKAYSVEAKSREPGKPHLAVRNQLYKALRKTAQHERIVMIDVNVPHRRTADQELNELMRSIKSAEPTMTVDGLPAPPAIIVVTNHPFHYELDEVGSLCTVFTDGFKIPEFGMKARFPTLTDAFHAYRKYADIYRVSIAIEEYEIPSFFEPRPFSLGRTADNRIWVMGAIIPLAECRGEKAVLIGAAVSITEKIAFLRLRHMQTGRVIGLRLAMSDENLHNYARVRHRTYFGGSNIDAPAVLFSWCYDFIARAHREELLLMVGPNSSPDKSDEELRLVYCELFVQQTMGMDFRLTSASAAGASRPAECGEAPTVGSDASLGDTRAASGAQYDIQKE